MAVEFTSSEIQEKYDRFARKYNWTSLLGELLVVSHLRRRLLQQAVGKVLEVAVGTGRNLPYYPDGCVITAVDISKKMLEMAQARAKRLGLSVSFQMQDAASLSFVDGIFDTVVSTLSLCTYPEPVPTLHELGRVCRKGGQILLLEHGRSDREWCGRRQDRNADKHAQLVGCHSNREPLELVRQTGMVIVRAERFLFGTIHVIQVTM